MRKLRYLAAGAAALAKLFFLGAIAVGMGLSDSGGFVSSYLRYLMFPQTVPAICLFFLWFDEEKYKPFKPLAILIEIGSSLFLAMTMVSAAGNYPKLLLAAQNVPGLLKNAAAGLAAFLIDLFCLIALVSGPRPRGDRRPAAAPEDGEAKLPDKEQ